MPHYHSAITLFRVATPTRSVYRATEEEAQDAVIAYALRGEVAMIHVEHVPVSSVLFDEDGTIVVREALEAA